MCSAGSEHSIALNSKGHIFSWGRQFFNKDKILNLNSLRIRKINNN